MRKNPLPEPHLVLREVRLQKGAEWRPQFRGWCLLQTGSGASYWQEAGVMREVPPESALIFPAEAPGILRASQLNDVAIRHFCVEPGKLLGLLTVREQHVLQQIAHRKNPVARLFPPSSPAMEPMKALPANGSDCPATTRLRLLEVFMNLFESEIMGEPALTAPCTNGRNRFRQIMNQMTVTDFVDLSIADLAPMVPCSPRHFNRLFREELGASFREKQIELRMARACELLAASDAKVVDVALESGYQSSSVFSDLFKRHVGTSPGQWRLRGFKSAPLSRVRH
jgi:AraC-like DNA-binding protein